MERLIFSFRLDTEGQHSLVMASWCAMLRGSPGFQRGIAAISPFDRWVDVDLQQKSDLKDEMSQSILQ